MSYARDLLRDNGFSRTEIINAANRLARDPVRPSLNKARRLCSAFDVGCVWNFLESLGGRASLEEGCFWTRKPPLGVEYRLTMLAFMLTWMEDE